jgi:DNA replication protein DnaC
MFVGQNIMLAEVTMPSDAIKTLLTELKLHGMVEAYSTQLSSRAFDGFSRDQIIEHLGVGESQFRRRRSQERLYKQAAFPHPAQPEDLIFTPERRLDKKKMAELLTCDWIERSENVVIEGATGVGKSHVGITIGSSAIRKGMSVRYFRTKQILQEMSLAVRLGKGVKLKSALFQPRLLILDDFGLGNLDVEYTEYLLDILVARNDTGATMVIGQRASAEWHDYLAEPQMADAIVDRLLQRSHHITLAGPSMRKRLD